MIGNSTFEQTIPSGLEREAPVAHSSIITMTFCLRSIEPIGGGLHSAAAGTVVQTFAALPLPQPLRLSPSHFWAGAVITEH